jgi:hypothetical protein
MPEEADPPQVAKVEADAEADPVAELQFSDLDGRDGS